MSDNELYQAALRKQLEILETRIVVHGNRVWQLPFTYIGFSAIASSIILERQVDAASFLFLARASVGILVMWAMFDAWCSYKRTGKAMNLVEGELKLLTLGTETSAAASHAYPHFAICFVTVAALMTASFLYI